MKRNRRQDSSRDAGPRNVPVARKTSSQFPRGDHMATAKSLVDKKRQIANIAVFEEHLGDPPQNKDLIEVRYVIPGEHMFPRGLDNPSILDSIRISHKVWITNIEPNIFKISGESMLQLRQVVTAINDTIHDMRLASEYLNTRFMVQKPSRDSYSVPIIFELGSRPHMSCTTAISKEMASKAIDAHATKIYNELLTNLDVLTSCYFLKMKVNFGHLNIRQKRKGQESQLDFSQLTEVLKIYSSRGGARLDTWLADLRLAERLFQRLLDPRLCFNKEEVRRSYSVILTIDDRELHLGAFILPDRDPQLSISKMTKPEAFARLNCTIAAPDMKFDWNLQVDSYEQSNDFPPDIRKLVDGMSLKIPNVENCADQEFVIPQLTIFNPGNWDSKISETRLRKSVTVPIKNTPYVADINITQKWKGLRPPTTPETGWGIEVYGNHWEEAVNQVRSGGRKKNWGQKMEEIWNGAGDDDSREAVETTFREFVATVWEVQSVLDGMGPVKSGIGDIGA